MDSRIEDKSRLLGLSSSKIVPNKNTSKTLAEFKKSLPETS
jgi:hypothetical protein